MKITTKHIPIRQLVHNFVDNGDDGVFTFNSDLNDSKTLLVCRPAYQREFVYTVKEESDLIKSIINGYPIGLFYWVKTDSDPDHDYELMDGQQRTISICSYINGDFDVDQKYFYNLTLDEQNRILDYEIMVNVCEGTQDAKLEWFKIVNKSGEKLTNQELRNAIYAGPWLSDAKLYFSKSDGPAVQLSDGFVKTGKINRQELLEKALNWICYRDNLKDVKSYMAKHQLDKDTQDLWQYYQDIVNWIKKLFPNAGKKLLGSQEWGKLYHLYKNNTYNPNDLQDQIDKLELDDDVTKKSGIIPYVLSEKTIIDQKYLNLRAFTPAQMRKKYKEQNGICPICHQHYEYNEMAGDHIIPWSQGGKTEEDNLQMLCKHDNTVKSNKLLSN